LGVVLDDQVSAHRRAKTDNGVPSSARPQITREVSPVAGSAAVRSQTGRLPVETLFYPIHVARCQTTQRILRRILTAATVTHRVEQSSLGSSDSRKHRAQISLERATRVLDLLATLDAMSGPKPPSGTDEI
jgi:hypothetical protein